MALPTYGARMGDPALAAGAAQDVKIASHDVSLASLLTTVTAQGIAVASHTSSISDLQQADQMPAAFMTNTFLPPTATTTATVLVNNKTYFQYIGRIIASKGTARICFVLKTSAVANADPSSDWGEVAVWKGVPSDPLTTAGIPASLLRLGFVDCYTDLLFKAAPGLLTVSPSWNSSLCQAGTDIWVSFGSNAQTAAQFESTIINRFALGVTLRADGQSSTLGTNDLVTTGLSINSTVGSPVVAAWFT